MMFDKKEENKQFIEKFDFKKHGFYDETPFINVNIGFSVKKKLKSRQDDYVTLLSIYISKRIDKTETTKKPLNIRATYGKEAEGGGVFLRENPKFTDPIDIESSNEYFYDIVSKEFFENNKKITADQILKGE